jgi:hypothetical protein
VQTETWLNGWPHREIERITARNRVTKFSTSVECLVTVKYVTVKYVTVKYVALSM